MTTFVPVVSIVFSLLFVGCKMVKQPESGTNNLPDSTTTVNQGELKNSIAYFDPKFLVNNRLDLLESTASVVHQAQRDFDVYKRTVPTITLERIKYFVIQGDEKLTVNQLLDYWITFTYSRRESLQIDTSLFENFKSTKSIIGLDENGKALTWPKGTRLKFCILENSFPLATRRQKYLAVKNNFLSACKDWEGICDIKFVYMSQYDRSPIDEVPAELKFSVIYTEPEENDDKDILANAFYKNDPSPLKLRVYPNYFVSTVFNPVGIFRHEIGHIMGFRHEHISENAASDCKTESRARTRETSYDFNSVMHYVCGDFDNFSLNFTKKDSASIQSEYGEPKK